MKKVLISAVLLLLVSAVSAIGQEKTVINSPYAKRLLVGKHMLSLQWISWDYFGRADVTESEGVLKLVGSQKGRGNDDLLEVDGVITEVNRYNFKFNGKITTKISHINEGNKCVREGEMTFAITKNRKYWRLQGIDNPCDAVADYVDVYFRR